jgi:uncharacterized DUF497 family protein
MRRANGLLGPSVYINAWREVIHLIGTLSTSRTWLGIVRPDEAEQVLAGDLMDLNHNATPDGEERWTAVGRTLTGRILVVVWTILEDGSHRTITAYPATKGLEAVYFCLTRGA